jgi:D-glycero-alpha-D-manno-heptose-7-phosphate kinase
MLLPSINSTGIRSRAPLRLGLAGGGTDVSPYSDEYGGLVLNATVDRYAFATIEPSHDWKIRFVASDLEKEEVFPLDIDALESAELKLHAGVYRRILRQFLGGRPLPVTVHTTVDAPAGSGLGSSSALVVALVEAFRAVLDIPLGPYDIAHLSHEIERVDLGLAGGKQDQYSATFGGINFIEFLKEERVIVNPLRVSRGIANELEASLVCCFSGVSRNSDAIIRQQQDGMNIGSAKTLDNMHQLKADAVEMKDALLRGNIPEMAKVLNKSWEAKKQTAAGVSNDEIDHLFASGRAAGAWGGKVSGAGGGGFLMFLVPPERRANIISALNRAGGAASGVEFKSSGVESWTIPGRSPTLVC